MCKHAYFKCLCALVKDKTRVLCKIETSSSYVHTLYHIWISLCVLLNQVEKGGKERVTVRMK